jgi:tetratricopeptide (TPR) repeat protein
MRALCTMMGLLLTLFSPVSRAATDDPVGAALKAMAAWNMAEARRAVDEVVTRTPDTPVAWLVQGQMRFFEGHYDEASTLLTRAAAGLSGDNGIANHLAEMSRAVGDVTRGYASHTTSGGHFTIHWKPGIDDVMIPWMDAVLEAAWSALTVQFGQTPEFPVRVELYPKADTLAAVTPLTSDEIRQSGTIALCKYNRLMITSPRDLVYGYGWADTLAHEFIHMLITQRSRNQVPIWLHEGLAKFYEVGWREDTSPSLDVASKTLLAKALAQDSLISFDAMSPSMAKLPNQEATATAFAEVHTVIDFLLARHGEALPRSLTTMMADGKSDQETVASLAKIPWSRFEVTWKGHLKRQGYKRRQTPFDTRLLFKGHDTEADELTQIKGEEGRRFVWLGDRLSVEDRPLAASKEYRKAADAVGEPVPLIQAKLGRSLLALGKVEQARGELEKTLKLYPEYMLTRLLLGEAYLRQGEPDAARTHLEEAALINPFDPQLHDHLRTVYEALGETDRAARAAAAHAKVMAHAPAATP